MLLLLHLVFHGLDTLLNIFILLTVIFLFFLIFSLNLAILSLELQQFLLLVSECLLGSCKFLGGILAALFFLHRFLTAQVGGDVGGSGVDVLTVLHFHEGKGLVVVFLKLNVALKRF